MKRFAKTIAMVLVLVMAAGSFTGCVTKFAYENGWGSGGSLSISGGSLSGIGIGGILLLPFVAVGLFLLPVAVDVVLSPIELTIFIVESSQAKKLKESVIKYDETDTFPSITGYIPEREQVLLAERINALPETEITVFTETINSFSEMEIAAMIEAFNSLSEAQIASSIEALNSMPDEMLIAALNSFQHIEFRYHD